MPVCTARTVTVAVVLWSSFRDSADKVAAEVETCMVVAAVCRDASNNVAALSPVNAVTRPSVTT